MEIKEFYESPSLYIIEFDANDIIATSTLINGGEGTGEGSDFEGWYE